VTKVQIEPNRCVGHGLCYTVVPDLIEDDDRGIAHVRGDGDVPRDRLHALRQAERLCPEQAVLITPEDGDPQD
jgi:ferredoxin